MQNCKECKKTTAGVLVADPDGSDLIYMPNICEACMWKLAAKTAENLGKPNITCKECDTPTHILVSGRCRDCHIGILDLVDSLPEVDPLPPPLGYIGIIGADALEAEMIVMDAYNGTPDRDELEH